ncbi:uncharacterized protein VICG_00851 [Vittaforma corneae ATCC 50505]|uniref:Thioredoxin domain-containing protein n=1 Tax=Vittaforma corneae (strain ATCC 50505) TaxID=993615 RepID=L2GMT5_VITCO|nr:uncharacterized protein VICG_00851 [Vittaforma corneae ATCC 50505]ELA42208.1 hypothetical protein VICG_00851 [Vittaforma corneae ATCC 50505]
MFVLLLLIHLLNTKAAEIHPLTKQDITLDHSKADSVKKQPFLVFIYYERKDFSCPLCEEFKDVLPTLNIPVKTLNFAENVELGSRFLQHTFPAFIVRYSGKSYVIEVQSTGNLREIIDNESWRMIKPVRSIIDVNSAFAIAFSKANRIIFFGIHVFYYMMNYVPDYAVSLFIVAIMFFLVYSIIDVLGTKNPKEKAY